MLISIQYARALAALLVVCVHMRGFAVFAPLDFGEFGLVGVDIFFVISGFIMWQTSAEQSPGDFVGRRISRVVPAYWLYTTLLIVLAVAVPRVTPNIRLDAHSILSSYFFIPYVNQNGQTNPLLLQGWTLNYEMFFYAVFALSLFIPRRPVRLVVLVAFFLAASIIGLFVNRDRTILAFYTSSMPLEFVFGILIAVVSARAVPTAVRVALLLAGLVCLAAASLHPLADLPRVLQFGLPSAFFIYGMIGLEPLIRRRPLPWLIATGNCSYSLYLLHPFVLSGAALFVKMAAARLPGFDGVAGALLFGLVAVAASLVLAHFSFVFFERPVDKWLKSLFAAPGGKILQPRYDRAPIRAAERGELSCRRLPAWPLYRQKSSIIKLHVLVFVFSGAINYFPPRKVIFD